MKLKAQNTMEIITAVAVVAVIAVAVFMFTSARNENLANLTGVKPTAESVDMLAADESSRFSKSLSPAHINEETAGSMANMVKTASKTELTEKLSSKTDKEITSFQSDDGKDVIDLANELIDELDLNFSKITRDGSVEDISNELVNVSLIAKEKLNGKDNTTYNTFLAVLGNIINE